MARKGCRAEATTEQTLTPHCMHCTVCGQMMWIAYRTQRTITRCRGFAVSRSVSAGVAIPSVHAIIVRIDQKRKGGGPYRMVSLA